jgi:mannose-1-phosphate guanylyltransferase / mannose-6-phosphate isomerase
MAHSKIHISPVILCGGSGTRLWPLSRSGFPKQFLVMSGKNSLFQDAIERTNNIASNEIICENTLIVTNDQHRFLVLDQLREIANVDAKILLEPEGKNTAPALTLAALEATKQGNDPVLVVTPADQVVQNSKAFTDVMRKAIQIASNGEIVTLGIKALNPETGFGYIQKGALVGILGESDVVDFVEKPDFETAKSYIASADFSWNAGIFVIRSSVWLEAIKNFRPDIFLATNKAYQNSTIDHQFIRPDPGSFAEIPSESIDYAVMENCPGSPFKIKVINLDAGWSDLGSWDAVWQLGNKDTKKNVTYGDVLLDDAQNNLVHANHRLVSAVGVSDLVIVETADAVMVTDRKNSQYVKNIVSQLSSQKREEHVLHRKVRRPWGWYDTIDVGERFKVKRILVNPGASLSLQKHAKRAEHWVVVKGTAEVTCGERRITLKENESTFIPLGEVHRLSNPSSQPLEIIEVQSGLYLGEDDIVRMSDGYGRG